MNHEDIKQDEQYTINRDKPFESRLEKGEQVIVIGTQATPFPNVPHNFRVESLRAREEDATVPVWVVAASNLDPANTEYDPETGEAIAPNAE